MWRVERMSGWEVALGPLVIASHVVLMLAVLVAAGIGRLAR